MDTYEIQKDLQKALINEAYCSIEENGIVSVLDATSKPKFHFPLIWLDTDRMMLQSLIEKEYIKMN